MRMNDVAMNERASVQSPAGVPTLPLGRAQGTPLRQAQGGPWYKEPWPWILMAGPAVVVVAGFVTLWIAVTTFDGMVADDYYKQGLAINKVLERDRAAARLGLQGEATLSAGADRVAVTLTVAPPPGSGLRLRVMHFAQAGLDQTLVLKAGPGGAYGADLVPLGPGRWQLVLEDEAKSWRLAGQWRLPQERTARLEAAGGPTH
ncbi:MAG TPA: FixH family protein [Burkholderiales bacterium]|nr:FixH family protein [Burkholderiales bacterium]